MPLARLKNATREHKRRRQPPLRALDSVTIQIDPGEHIALLGPNGAGKSTLLRLLAGLDRPDAGEACPPKRADLAVVFQEPALDPLLTIRENLNLQRALFTMRTSAETAAKTLDLTNRLDDRVSTLSGGLARRADLARALLTEPKLLLLDEPTTGLDHAARASFLDTLDAQREANPDLAIVLSTHLMDEAERASRVVMLDRGKVVADASPEALRSELGGPKILRCAAQHAELLTSAGLTVTISGNHAHATGDAAAAGAASDALVRAGADFNVSEPTLADAYLARTGKALP